MSFFSISLPFCASADDADDAADGDDANDGHNLLVRRFLGGGGSCRRQGKSVASASPRLGL